MLRVLTRVLAVQMGKEGHISEMLCGKNLQAAESKLGYEPGGGTRRSRCPGDSAERQPGGMDGGMGRGTEDGWVSERRDGVVQKYQNPQGPQEGEAKGGQPRYSPAGWKLVAACPREAERLQILIWAGDRSPVKRCIWETK